MADEIPIVSGFEDHHHAKAEPFTPDPNHRASQEVKDKAWDILQNGFDPNKIPDAPLQPGYMEVNCPIEYVDAISYCALQELKARHCREGFSVKTDLDEAKVHITFQRSHLISLPGGDFQGTTDCLAAWMQQRDPGHVGKEAVDVFTKRLHEVLNQ